MEVEHDAKSGSTTQPIDNSLPSRVFQLKVFMPAFGAYVLLWFSFPPVAWAPLAWVALVPLIGLVLVPDPLPGRPYRKLYAAGLLYWLATFYFIPIPHPALWAGWAAVSMYMAVYTPLTIAACRTMVHRWKIPPAIAVPVVWVGVEWIRSHFATGMAMVCLSHSQAKFPALIQLASVSGAYAVTFVMVTVATCLAIAWRRWRNLGNWIVDKPSGQRGMNWPVALGVAIAVFAINLGFGLICLKQSDRSNDSEEQTLQVALVQTNVDVVFAVPSVEEVERQLYDLADLTNRAVRMKPDLIVWSETAFPYNWQLEEQKDQRSAIDSEDLFRIIWGKMVGDDRTSGTPLLTGVRAQNASQRKFYNSAVLINHQGELSQRYDKIHLVMFGEYIPFGKALPFLEQLAPMPSLQFGQDFEAYQINNFTIAPSICFETTVPHLIRRQMNELAAEGMEPDVMINLTNDGWFFGTACLDHHLACNIFRAVEMRKPNLVCANTGLSGHIDPFGRLISVGPRRTAKVLNAVVEKPKGSSIYRMIGDFLPALFGWTTVVAWVFGFLITAASCIRDRSLRGR